ncbi:DegV family protein [Agrilactobacillus yilanensis]|uniref:DegV family protein n=1 Tax=Agrilactobacillus yilanensis TaxID=2485997 RepID=A0ABW4J991_9LACO|nr:DegV family protein [Agrilactobacillus yilanensis]
MKLAIVTDSTAYLTSEQITENNIKVIPIPLTIDGESYLEGVNLSTTDFYSKLKNSKTLPTTSQPPLGEVLQLYSQLAAQGYDTVLSIHLSSTISGFVQNLKVIARDITAIKVIPYDSHITVMLMGHLVLEAAKLARQGADLETIIQKLNELRASMDEVFIVSDLQNLVKGGRLSNASAFVGSILKIKPLLTFDSTTHKITAFEKIRSLKKAYSRAEDLFDQAIRHHDYPLRAIIIHGNNLAEAKKWQQRIQEKQPEIPIELSYFGPVVGAHLGDKSIALAWLKNIDK